MRQRELLMRAKRSFPSLNSGDAGFVPSTEWSSYAAIARDLVRTTLITGVAPEHFVSSAVLKVPRIGDLKTGYVQLTAAVTNVHSGPPTGLR